MLVSGAGLETSEGWTGGVTTTDEAGSRGFFWVVMGTGSNQAFVFATNRQRVNLGASELIRRSGTTWVDEAIADVRGESEDSVTSVIKASGKSVLLVRDRDVGRSIIEQVTRRARAEAPGLEIWGIVDDVAIAEDFSDAHDRLQAAYAAHDRWRRSIVSARARHPVLPPVRVGRVGAGPVTAVRTEGTRELRRNVWLDSQSAAGWELSQGARQELRAELGPFDSAVPEIHRDGVELSDNGWVAVLHADGNQIGDLFLNLHRHYRATDFITKLRALSTALDDVTRRAFFAAVHLIERSVKPPEGWLLPLIIGGDDVTAVINGQVATAFTVAFLRSFEELSKEDPVISAVTTTMRGQAGLAAAAGLHFVKPHHPFHAAYQVADSLTSRAKSVGTANTSAFDFSVSYDSISSPLHQTRSAKMSTTSTGQPLRLWGGPYTVRPDSPVEGPHGAPNSRDVEALLDLVRSGWAYDVMRACPSSTDPIISRTASHSLRIALLSGGAHLPAAQRRAGAVGGDTVAELLSTHLTIAEPKQPDRAGDAVPDAYRTMWFDALELMDVTRGTVAGTASAASGDDRTAVTAP